MASLGAGQCGAGIEGDAGVRTVGGRGLGDIGLGRQLRFPLPTGQPL